MSENSRDEELDEAFVTALYESILKRSPDPSGLKHYVGLLRSNELTRPQVVDSLVASLEFKHLQNSLYQESTQSAQGAVVRVGDANKQGVPYELFEIKSSIFHDPGSGYMSTTNCVSSDFFHPDYHKFCALIDKPPSLHRKLWEYAFIFHHLRAKGVVGPGKRGIGFGVGVEPLPSLFAHSGCNIVATDAPPLVANPGWELTSQHSNCKEDLHLSSIIGQDLFDDRVSFSFADMKHIPDQFKDFDFCWSSCSFEHLGSIKDGLEFVENSIERVLKSGGVACHTSELNITSNVETIESGDTVLFRRRDIDELLDRLERRGHKCERLPIIAPSSFVDYLVDIPPYSDACLKIRLGQYITTSFGIVVTRG